MKTTIPFHRNVQMIAHRGLSGLETENTCSAFVAAGNHPSYFGIETDVHRTLDGKFVIFHDDNTARVGIDSLVIEETTFETLRNLTLKNTDGVRSRADLRIPTLEEYIGICEKYGKTCVLELKNRFETEDIRRIVEIVRGTGYLDHVIFISFVLENLVDLRAILPDQPAQFLIGREWKDSYYDDLDRNHLDLDIDHRLLTADIVKRVKAAGHEVNCWTVNTEEDGNRAADLGVDYITTNILEKV